MGELDLDRVRGYVEARREEHHIPALAVAVVSAGEILLADGFGVANLEWTAQATSDTAFQLASATKLLTATLLMLLVESGEVRLGASVKEYLTEAPESWARISVRHLASHTSGIPDGVGEVESVEGAVTAAARLPLEYEPGSRVRYGLVDYAVLTRVLEIATSTPFQQLLQLRLLDPLGMSSTRFDNAEELGDQPVRVSDVVPRRASVYNWDGKAQRGYAFLFPRWTYSAGGLYSSAGDLARWAAALDGGDLLSRDSQREMLSRQALTDGTEGPFGVGWIVDEHSGRRVAGHSGGPALADIVRFPEEHLTVVVLTNQ
ncbi:MAG: beta-lactamase family protein [Chloroflexota bacterium]|nr:beta-lactamase family protein [Chloroflexota bacterium]